MSLLAALMVSSAAFAQPAPGQAQPPALAAQVTADDCITPMVAEPGAAADAALFATGPQRMALIIANGDYNQDHLITPDAAPIPGQLPDLRTTHENAKLLRARLLAMGWSETEAGPLHCDVTRSDMNQLISAFAARLAKSADGSVGVIYFTGHGAEVHFNSGTRAQSHNLLFPVGAGVDLPTLKQLAQSAASEDEGAARVLPALQDASVDLDRLVGTFGAQSQVGLVVILDACRNNPLRDSLGLPNNMKAIVPPGEDESLDGIVLAFSTQNGRFAAEGKDKTTLYTSELAQSLKPQIRFADLFESVYYAVKKKDKNTPKQLPRSVGHLPGPWCVSHCASDDSVAGDAPPVHGVVGSADQGSGTHIATQPAAARLILAAWQADATPPTPAASATTPSAAELLRKRLMRNPLTLWKRSQEQTTRKAQAVPLDPMTFDISWCDEGDQSRELEERANEIGISLATVARQRVAEDADAQVETIRKRPLSIAGNANARWRFSEDVLLYNDSDPVQRAWAEAIAKSVGVPLIQRSGSDALGKSSSSYISIVICRAPTANPSPTTTFFLQVPDDSLKPVGTEIERRLADAVPSYHIAGAIDVRDNSPDMTEVRFYHIEDRDTVFATTNALEAILGKPITIKYLAQYSGTTTPGRAELWLGKLDKIKFKDVAKRERVAAVQ